ncbi:ETX/MTX2 family pore-forming toxin [Hymenobacter sp.]|uniref:ETX/MTX2 family pore-forming toxin n=1 Tax=Hymenobacter sp. TaxID=1898978 RepID=UPI002EDAE033
MNTKWKGGGIRYTASTDYNAVDSWLWKNYPQYQVVVTPVSFSYSPAPAPVMSTQSSVTTNNVNKTGIQESVQYTQGMTTQQQFTWTVTNALSVGVEVTASVGVPSVANVGSKVSTTLSFTKTTTTQVTNTQNWSVMLPVVVPPRTTIDTRLVVTIGTYNVPWTATAVLMKSVAIWFNNKVALNGGSDAHNLWFVPITTVFADVATNLKGVNLSGYQNYFGGGVGATSSGTFTGGQGVQAAVDFTQPTAAEADAAAATQNITSMVPLDNGMSTLIGVDAPVEAAIPVS